MTPLISVITPCRNAATFIADAIDSVLAQDYPAFEHIVVDGASQDGTCDIVARYPHLRFSSEPDRGQSAAMNKGFARARGDVIVYLNADDYFEPGAFAAASRTLAAGAEFVVGKVRILRNDGSAVINDPKIELEQMLKWWQPDAYAYNPTGYFYRRAIQEAVGPFNEDDHYTMDFEFLVEAAQRCAFTRIPEILGNFRYLPGTKTYENSATEWRNFQRFEKYLELFDEPYRRRYLQERAAYLQTLQGSDVATTA